MNIIKAMLLLCLALPAGRAISQPIGIDSLIRTYMEENKVPGCAAVIVRDGRLVYERYFGYADLSKGIPVTATTSFMLASVSKTVTATALMNEAECGKFRLQDSIETALPFAVRNPLFPARPITFQHLLTHTSGIRDNWEVLLELYTYGDSPIGLGEFLRAYLIPGGAYYRPDNYYNSAPQASYNYSNVGSALLGLLVEYSSGTSFDRYCRDSIFAPLGMANTSWFLSGLDTLHVARPYGFYQGEYLDYGHYGYPDYPDGQLRTTAVSLAKFMLMHMQDGWFDGVRVLDSATVRQMRTVQFPALAPGQGLIFHQLRRQSGLLWGHNGKDAGAGTSMYFDPERRMGIIVLTNGDADVQPISAALLDYSATIPEGTGNPLRRDYATAVEGDAASNAHLPGLYPNPAGSYVRCDNCTIEAVYDVMGTELLRGAGGLMDLSSLPDGVYLVRIAGDSFSATRRLVKTSQP